MQQRIVVNELDEAARRHHSAEDLAAREGFERNGEENKNERYPGYGPVPGPNSDGIGTESGIFVRKKKDKT
jgi:hypothetical protein